MVPTAQKQKRIHADKMMILNLGIALGPLSLYGTHC
jgi:hypothetical protein